MLKKCKKCLLLEAGEDAIFKTVSDYLFNLDDDLKVDNKTYQQRLNICQNCLSLISGTCLKCGCYVEIRCALKDKTCPDFENKKW